MSREIKFRAWDTEKGCFFEPIFEAYNGKIEDLTITFHGELVRRTFLRCADHESLFLNRYILSQYTGLNDRNGKEIFEGDVIKYSPLQLQGFKVTKVLEVIFDKGQFKTEVSTVNAVHLICEVIGNRFENPELLGGSDA